MTRTLVIVAITVALSGGVAHAHEEPAAVTSDEPPVRIEFFVTGTPISGVPYSDDLVGFKLAVGWVNWEQRFGVSIGGTVATSFFEGLCYAGELLAYSMVSRSLDLGLFGLVGHSTNYHGEPTFVGGGAQATVRAGPVALFIQGGLARTVAHTDWGSPGSGAFVKVGLGVWR